MTWIVGTLTPFGGGGTTLQDAVQKNPTAGISKLFQAAVVTGGFCQIVQNEFYFKEDGTEAKFPEITRDYNSLVRFFEKNRWDATAAVC